MRMRDAKNAGSPVGRRQKFLHPMHGYDERGPGAGMPVRQTDDYSADYRRPAADERGDTRAAARGRRGKITLRSDFCRYQRRQRQRARGRLQQDYTAPP